MTPTSPGGIQRRHGRYAERMDEAKSPLDRLTAEFDYLRTAARRVDPEVLDEALRPSILALRASRTRLQELFSRKGSSE